MLNLNPVLAWSGSQYYPISSLHQSAGRTDDFFLFYQKGFERLNQLAQRHRVNKWQSWDLNTCSLAPKPTSLTTTMSPALC